MSDRSGTPSSEITDGTDPPCVLVLGHPLEERVGRNQRPRHVGGGIDPCQAVTPTLPAVGD